MSKPVEWGSLELPIRPDTIISEPAEPRRLLSNGVGGGVFWWFRAFGGWWVVFLWVVGGFGGGLGGVDGPAGGGVV